MTIRKWKFKDILKIAELEKECFPREPWSYASLVSSFETETFTVVLCEDGGEIIAYGGISVAADTADILNVAVAENFRNAGTGAAIVGELCKTAKEKGAKNVFLEVRVSNSAALKLYLKCGFKGAYARPRYYPDGEDCLVMVKEL